MRAESSRYDNEIITTSELNSIIEEKLLSLLDGKTREKTLSESSATPLLDREIYNPYPRGVGPQREKAMPPHCCDEPATLVEIFAAELLGTALMMFFGCMGLFASASKFEMLAPMQGGLVFSFVVASVIVAFGRISGAHLNPAVTLCSYLLGNIPFITAIVYVAAEIIGAVFGFWLLKESVPPHLFSAYVNGSCGFCNTIPDPNISLKQAFTMEFLITAFLILIVCSTWDPRNAHNTNSAPIKFALFIAAASIAVGPFTGAGMNPARSFAPAYVNNIWANHWIYWVAPLTGSLVATLFYKLTFIRKWCSKEDCPYNKMNHPWVFPDGT